MPRAVFNVPETADIWFWPRVDKSGECWIWTAGKSAGYGMVRMNRRFRHAHAIAWELVNGPVPDGLDVLHNCPGGDNKACVNPAHLWLGTQRDNTLDWYCKVGRLRYPAKPAPRLRPVGVFGHCPNGHPLSASTTVTNPETGVHHCKACRDTSIRFTRETPALYSVGAA